MQLRRLILEKIFELGDVVLDSFFPAKYPEARLWRDLLDAGPSYKFSKPTFSSILSQLRKEGFVARKNSRKYAIWAITAKGADFLERNKGKNISMAVKIRKPVKDGIMRIVSFDIPEKQRKKRRWIREELLGLGYKCLQKSVWVGFSPLPEDFFEDLDLLLLRNHIHVFSVNKKGTLQQL